MKKFLFTFFLFVVIMVCMPVAALADDVGSLSSPIDLSTIPDFFAVDSGDTAYVTTPAGVTVKNKSIRVYEGATLVLCDADISYIEKGWRQGAAITMYDNSSLKLVGTNNVTASQGTSSYTYAIVAGSSVTISDYEADSTVGELVIDTTPYDSVYGIYIYFGSLTLESGIINVNSGYGGIAGANSSTLTVNGGVITANGGVGPMGGSIGIQSETIIINGGIVTGNGGDYPGGGAVTA